MQIPGETVETQVVHILRELVNGAVLYQDETEFLLFTQTGTYNITPEAMAVMVKEELIEFTGPITKSS